MLVLIAAVVWARMMRLNQSSILGLYIGLIFSPSIDAGSIAELQIHADKILGRVSPLHSGLMTEEINHSFDGGLYGELIRNRVFTEPVRLPFTEPLKLPRSLPPHWSLVTGGSGAGVMALDDTDPLNKVLTESLRLSVISAPVGSRVGIVNDGFWGIPVRPLTRYHASFYARVELGSIDVLTLSLENPSLSIVYARASVRLIPGVWRHYEVDLTTPDGIARTAKAEFVIAAAKPGSVWLNLASLFPPTWAERTNGNRVDLMEKLRALHPAFLRFPGGDYLEGETVETRFNWKNTIGPISDRPTHPSPWGYQSSDGMGLLEFLEWCEDLHMEPIIDVYAGHSHKEDESVKSTVHPGVALRPFVQDALDEIEYVTGDANTTWGRRRSADGHERPFRLKYVEVGNEDWYKSDYEGRFAQFYDAIKSNYPELQIIASAEIKSRKPDVVDEHQYRKAQDFFDDVHHYDLYPRNGPKIFVGEWATIEDWPMDGALSTLNMRDALGDGAWMIGMERNSDLVIMQAYAPLFRNVSKGAAQGHGLIDFNAIHSYGSPSYYVQVMFNAHRGDEVLASSPGVAPELFTSVTRDSKSGTIYLKAVNVSSSTCRVRIEISGVARVEPQGKVIRLSGAPQDSNSISEPAKVVPVEDDLHNVGAVFDHAFPAYSVTVLEIHSH